MVPLLILPPEFSNALIDIDAAAMGSVNSAFAASKESGRFLEKAAQKLLLNWAYGSETGTAQLTKFFCYFCSQKVAFP
jgi:hypothetical protein